MAKQAFLYDGHEYSVALCEGRAEVRNNYGSVIGVLFPDGGWSALQAGGPVTNGGHQTHTYAEATRAIRDEIAQQSLA